MTWTIHRDGYAYTVPTHSYIEALHSACRVPDQGSWSRPESERTYHLPKGVSRCLAEPLPVEGLPTFVQPADTFNERFTLVWLADKRAQVKTVSVQEFAYGDRLRVVLTLTRKLRAARLTTPKHVAVERFKSGKRAGQLKFTRAHDDAFRKRVCGAIEFNAAREQGIEDCSAALARSLSTLMRPYEPSERVELEFEDVHAELETINALALLRPDYVRLPVLAARRLALARRREALDCVTDHGFDVGERVYVTRSPYAVEEETCAEGWGEVVQIDAGLREVEIAGIVWDVPISRCASEAP